MSPNQEPNEPVNSTQNRTNVILMLMCLNQRSIGKALLVGVAAIIVVCMTAGLVVLDSEKGRNFYSPLLFGISALLIPLGALGYYLTKIATSRERGIEAYHQLMGEPAPNTTYKTPLPTPMQNHLLA